ncbi:MAG: PRC-barrel domain-containing protein [Gemmatimonadaceae bacterium]
MMDSNYTYDSTIPDKSETSTLSRLNDLDDFKVADGHPDIRGWDVKTTDGQKVGKVGDLVVDTGAMRVRYLDVEVEEAVAERATKGMHGKDHRHTLLPIGKVQLDEDNNDVLIDGFTLEQVAGMPRYDGRNVTRDYERSLWSENEQPTANARNYEHDDFDDQRFYGKRHIPEFPTLTDNGTVNDSSKRRHNILPGKATESEIIGGEAVGGASGGIAGVALGAIGGPIGAVIGALAGTLTGWWAGRAVTEAAHGLKSDDSFYQQRYDAGMATRPTDSSANSYKRAQAAYHLGHLASMNPDYDKRSFDEIEGDLQSGWNAQPSADRASWKDVRDYARDAYGSGREQRTFRATNN